MRHRPRCRSREVTRRPHDAASPALLVTRATASAQASEARQRRRRRDSNSRYLSVRRFSKPLP